MINKLEENTNFMLQEYWKATFDMKYSFDSIPSLFKSRRPDGIQFIENGIIIIENKRDISMFNNGFKQLKEYVAIIYEHFKNLNIYGVLGFGTDELIKIAYKFDFENDNMKCTQIDIIMFKQLKFMKPEEWLIKYYNHKNVFVIEVNESNRNKVANLLKTQFNIQMQSYVEFSNSDSNSDSNEKSNKVTSEAENVKNIYKIFLKMFFKKSDTLISLEHIYKLATEINLKGNDKLKQGSFCKVISSSKISIRIVNDIILDELMKLFKNNMYIINDTESYEINKKHSIDELIRQDIVSKYDYFSKDDLDMIYVLIL